MAKYKVVILQDSQDSINLVYDAIKGSEQFEIVGMSADGVQGYSTILSTKPDFVIMGIILKNLDGFAVMDKIRSSGIKTKIVVLSSFTGVGVIERAMNSGAVYYIAKPFNQEVLLNRLLELCEEGEVQIREKSIEIKKGTLEEKISKIFISVGIPPHIKGYHYLREGVKMAVENPDIINNITKQLYPKIGLKYSTTASKVERAIRHAIEVAFNRGRIETINTILGIRAYVGNEKPTNGEFIALIADKMLLEGA